MAVELDGTVKLTGQRTRQCHSASDPDCKARERATPWLLPAVTSPAYAVSSTAKERIRR